jgi:hypothetical protein
MNPFEAIFRTTPELVIALEQHRDKRNRLPLDSSASAPNLLKRWLAISGVVDTQRALTDFNIFAALNANEYELRHSSFLAWLFDPAASHGRGPAFLQAFLALVATKARVGERKTIKAAMAQMIGFSTAKIIIETKGVDLLVVDRAARFICLIENKIHTGEHSDQLARYRRMVSADYPTMVPVFVFLTLRNEEPSDSAYLPISYRELCQAICPKVPLAPSMEAREAITLLFQQYVDFIEGCGVSPPRPNVFAALRLREIKHSDFLAWLFNPNANHGLGIAPFREFLRLVQERRSGSELPLFAEGNWDDFEITRETYNIDLLIVSERHRFVCLIENKLEAREGKDQLQRYKAYIRRWYPNFQEALVFLTLRGDQPTDPDYMSMRFADYVPWLRGRLAAQSVRHWTDGTVVQTLLEHYHVLIKERLSLRLKTVTQLAPVMDVRCKEVWQSEPVLVPSILAGVRGWRASVKADMESFIGELIFANFGSCFRPGFFSGRFRDYLPFVPKEIDEIIPLRKGGHYNTTGDRLFDFLVLNRPFEDYALTGEPVGITIIATLRPPGSGYQRLRNVLNAFAHADRALFNKADRDRIEGIGNYRIMSQTLVGGDDFLRHDPAAVKARLRERFRRFAFGPYLDILRLYRHPSVSNYSPG